METQTELLFKNWKDDQDRYNKWLQDDKKSGNQSERIRVSIRYIEKQITKLELEIYQLKSIMILLTNDLDK